MSADPVLTNYELRDVVEAHLIVMVNRLQTRLTVNPLGHNLQLASELEALRRDATRCLELLEAIERRQEQA